MNRDEAQEILEIADYCSGNENVMSLSKLAKILGCGSPRAAAAKLKSAWDFFNREGDMVACAKISDCFVDRNGNHAWE